MSNVTAVMTEYNNKRRYLSFNYPVFITKMIAFDN